MKVLALIYLLVAGVAFAGEPQVISGASNPERIPDYVAINAALQVATSLEGTYPDGADRFARVSGVSAEGVRALIHFQKQQNEADRMSPHASVRMRLCAQREQLSTKESLLAEVRRIHEEKEQRAKDRAMQALAILNAQDASTMLAFVRNSRTGISMLGGRSVEGELESMTPAEYLQRKCGGGQT